MRGPLGPHTQGVEKFHRQGETIQKTKRELAEYVGQEFDEGKEFHTKLAMLTLQAPVEPVPPEQPQKRQVRT